MIGFQKDGYRLARHVEHGRDMAQNDHIREPADFPALFADITALLEDAHEIAVRGQNSKLERLDYLRVMDELQVVLGRVQSQSETIQQALR